MGWFWADPVCHVPPSRPPHGARDGSPPPSCPMHKRTAEALNPSACKRPDAPLPASACPVPHGSSSDSTPPPSEPSTLSKLNPLNYMFHTLSQSPAPSQTYNLPTTRDESSIPKGTASGEKWEYPSPQQMYNALLRKGYTDTDVTAVESMVSIHNFLNEGAWAEIVDWERRFGKGLRRGWQVSRRGEENAEVVLRRLEAREGGEGEQPSLLRFQGRPKDMTPKAAMLQVLGWAWPEKFGTEPPFDRHDWYVGRNVDGEVKEVRYIIDYYSGGEEPTGEPVFFLDVRPALTPTAAVERLMRWGGDVWWKAAGGEVHWGNKPASP